MGDRLALKGWRVVVGDGMEVLSEYYVVLKGTSITRICSSRPVNVGRVVKLDGCAIIPGLINAHVHLGDAGFKDVGIGLGLNELFKPYSGLKHKLLSSCSDGYLVEAMKKALLDMMKGGITLFADFREGGVGGVNLLLRALKDVRIKGLILGRVDYAFSLRRLRVNKGGYPSRALRVLKKLVKVAHGVAPSGANELTDDALKQYAEAAKGLLKAIHVSENPMGRALSVRRTGLTEVERVLRYFKPSFLVHLTYASDEELRMVYDHGVPVVCCPRANALLGLKLPPIPMLLKLGVCVALGTDNVMINPPNMFREMEFVLKAYSSLGFKLQPREVLKLATINGAKALGLGGETGSIDAGKR
ncbi:MAG: amidohydrolase family protein, partial [Candidatus Nezhaarchaeales archaeon]